MIFFHHLIKSYMDLIQFNIAELNLMMKKMEYTFYFFFVMVNFIGKNYLFPLLKTFGKQHHKNSTY